MAGSSLSVKDAWNAVALEERLEMLARSRADGIIAGAVVALLIGAIAYGFDQVWLLAGSLAGALLAMPICASYSWRKNKPAVILSYLAVRSVARRYAYGYKVGDFSVILIFRGTMRQLFASDADEAMARQRESVDFDSNLNPDKKVWVCLMRGGLVCLSERLGGAKLEFITPVSADLQVGSGSGNVEGGADQAVIVTATTGDMKGRSVKINSEYSGCMYVLERQLRRLVEENRQHRERLEKQQTAGTVELSK